MSEKLNLTYVNRQDRTGAKGPYVSISIKTKEYNESTYLSGFGNTDNANWKVGDVVEVESVERKEVNGKIYLNFKMPLKSKGPSAASPKIEALLEKISNQLAILVTFAGGKTTTHPTPTTGYSYPVKGEVGTPADEPNFEPTVDEFGDPIR